jgi:ComF family protein
MVFVDAANLLLHALLAAPCAACARVLTSPLTSPVCQECWNGIERLAGPLCDSCGEPLGWSPLDDRRAGVCARCLRSPPAYRTARSVGRYDGSLRAIVHALKYDGRRLLAPPLGKLMRAAGAGMLSCADAVVPVPLHPRRAWDRGYNQADDLARAIGLPVWRVLRRTRHGPPQATLPAARRLAMVRTAFVVCRFPWTPDVRRRTLVLIDDVMTTGATADACAAALQDAGAAEVSVLTAARAAAGPPARRPRRPDRSTATRR